MKWEGSGGARRGGGRGRGRAAVCVGRLRSQQQPNKIPEEDGHILANATRDRMTVTTKGRGSYVCTCK